MNFEQSLVFVIMEADHASEIVILCRCQEFIDFCFIYVIWIMFSVSMKLKFLL